MTAEKTASYYIKIGEEKMSEQLKEYLEQEGISHDDVINQEIEEEHKETIPRNPHKSETSK